MVRKQNAGDPVEKKKLDVNDQAMAAVKNIAEEEYIGGKATRECGDYASEGGVEVGRGPRVLSHGRPPTADSGIVGFSTCIFSS